MCNEEKSVCQVELVKEIVRHTRQNFVEVRYLQNESISSYLYYTGDPIKEKEWVLFCCNIEVLSCY